MGDFTHEDVPSELPIKERSSVSCRRYSSPTRDNMIVVSITSGPPGAVSTHTPDVCYPGSGYRTISEPKKEILNLPDGTTATCLVAEYEKKNSTTLERHRIRWSWSVNGSWTIPDRPRFAFLSEQELFKLYVVTPIADTDINRLDAENPATTAFIAQVFAQYAALLR
jgi:hypothetical protein